jgi:hypothetical protein
MPNEHEAVPGGFKCQKCGTTRSTPLGIERHRALCYRRGDDS